MAGKKNRIYLDYAATTPVDPRVLKAMQPYFSGEFGNPGSLHSFGQQAIAAVDVARETIANTLGVDFREVIFTGSATEANNVALRGAVQRAKSSEPRAGGNKELAARSSQLPLRVIVSAVEHESVLETARYLEKDGVEVVYLPVDKNGVVKLSALKKALTPKTVLVSIMYVNNETGAVQPIKEIGKIIREFRSENLGFRKNPQSSILNPILTGGRQEFGLRSGTENVPAIVGFGKAAELAINEREKNTKQVKAMRDRFLMKLKAEKKILRFAQNDSGDMSPHILSLWIKDRKAEDVLTKLDLEGIAISSGSACRSRSFEPSHVLKAMGLSDMRVRESVRVSFGKFTTAAEVDVAAKALKAILE